MSGRFLYGIFVALQREINNCSADSWDKLEASEQRVWDALAGAIG